MEEKKAKNCEDSQLRKKQIKDRQAEIEKRIEKTRKEEEAFRQANIEKRNAKFSERAMKRRQDQRALEYKIKQMRLQEEKERVEAEQARKAAYDSKLNEEFERDRRAQLMGATTEHKKAQKEAEDWIQSAIKLGTKELVLSQKVQKKEAMLKERQDIAVEHSEKVVEQVTSKRDEEKKKNDEKLLTYMRKMEGVEKKRADGQAYKQAMLPEKKNHHERLNEIKAKHSYEARLQRAKINKGISQRNEQVQRNLSYLREENERRKELKELHKQDQQEALERRKAFLQVERENKVLMILEKASRVQKSPN